MKISKSLLGYAFVTYAALCLFLVIFLSQNRYIPAEEPIAVKIGPLPDFASFTDTQLKKAAFFNYLRPAVEQQNQLRLKTRTKILTLQASLQAGNTLSKKEAVFLEKLYQFYKVKSELSFDEKMHVLTRRVDIIPESMVLSQAAMESAWGTSRFAREANNLFGQWCFSKGCGIVPSKRGEGKSHEVAKFVTVDDAIASYFRNINTHSAYSKVRSIRALARENNQQPSGYNMVAGLLKYSAKGQKYVDSLRSLMKSNKLGRKYHSGALNIDNKATAISAK